MAPSVPTPQFGTPSAAQTITWSDGTLFNGWGVFGLVLPTTGGNSWPEADFSPNYPAQRLPVWSVIPIVNGQWNQQIGLIFNTSINPPNSKYAVFYFDTARTKVGGASSSSDFFTVSSIQFTPPTYTLTVPTAGTVAPVTG